jgi:hypothetical protein
VVLAVQASVELVLMEVLAAMPALEAQAAPKIHSVREHEQKRRI